MDNEIMQPLDFTRKQIEDQLEPVGGKQVLGTLDDNLITGFIEMSIAESDFNEVFDIMQKRVVEGAASRLFENHGNALMTAAQLHSLPIWQSEGEVAEYQRLHSHHQELWWSFWNRVRDTFKTWNSRLEIRRGFVVVYLGPKVDLPK